MDAELKNLVYDALSLIVMTLLPVLLGYLTAWMRQKYGAEQVANAAKTLALGVQIAQQAVSAVEQIAAAKGWDSPVKRAEAIFMAKSIGVKNALQLTDEQWATLIEAAVKNLKDWHQELKRPVVPAG